MAFERPTFHEAWYRVESLHPRLRSTVQISRQHFRDQTWHVVQDHTNNSFIRLTEPAYRLLGLLDGRRSVGDAWKICMDQLGDDAPTQPETIQLLGQLYQHNLLQAELAADTHGLFTRYSKRRTREVQGYLTNLMFARIPLIDPDAFLLRWMPLFGWIFSWVGLLVWTLIVGTGVYFLTSVPGWAHKVVSGHEGILAPSNIIWLYLCFALIKACHEMGHAISCRKFGIQSGTGGEVHVIGIMFLIFSPVPYVDASSSWALRSKWQRIVVGAAGMWIELAIAALAAIVWAKTNDTSLWHQLAYNVMFIASFSTIVFNANPLLRYDGYYMLSDLLEIPNLAQRSKEFIHYLVKRYVWNVKHARNPAHTPGEKVWMFFYAIASFLMRVVVTLGIAWYLLSVLSGVLIFLALIMGLAGLIGWILVPIGKFVHYLTTSPELLRVRGRAVLTTLLFVGLLVTAVGAVRAPDWEWAPGIVHADTRDTAGRPAMHVIAPDADGFVTSVLHDAPRDPATGHFRVTRGQTLLTARNEEIELTIRKLEAQLDEARQRRNIAEAEAAANREGPARAQAYDRQIATLEQLIKIERNRLSKLAVKAPIDGVLMLPELEHLPGAYIHQGDALGYVINTDRLVVVATVPNEAIGPIRTQSRRGVELRVEGRPDILLRGSFGPDDTSPSGTHDLRSPSLGMMGGGQIMTDSQDQQGTKAAERYFEIRITLDPGQNLRLHPMQRVVVGFPVESKSLAVQAWTKLQQLFQKRMGA